MQALTLEPFLNVVALNTYAQYWENLQAELLRSILNLIADAL